METALRESVTYHVTYKGKDATSDFGVAYIKLTPRIQDGMLAHGDLLKTTHREISAHVRSCLWYWGIKVNLRGVVWRFIDVKKCTCTPDEEELHFRRE